MEENQKIACENLRKFISNIGLAKTKELASKLNVHYLTLYNIAAGRQFTTAHVAIGLYRESKGLVDYKYLVKNPSEKTWPSDMFKEIDDWRSEQ